MLSDLELVALAKKAPAKAALLRAIKAAGSRAKLAAKLPKVRGRRLSPQAITDWVNTGRCPEHQLAAVSRVSGVPQEELRPDLFKPGVGFGLEPVGAGG